MTSLGCKAVGFCYLQSKMSLLISNLNLSGSNQNILTWGSGLKGKLEACRMPSSFIFMNTNAIGIKCSK